MNNDFIFLDFETFYDPKQGYSLRKLSTPEYVHDPRFKSLGCAIAIGEDKPRWFTEETLFKSTPPARWVNKIIISHNAKFDGYVLANKYGIKPKQWICTLSMARALLAAPKNDLGAVATLLKLGEKVKEYLTPGATSADDKLIEGALRDVELCRKVYLKLRDYMPDDEMALIDITIRCGITPRIVLNGPLLETELESLITERNQLIAASGYTEKQLASNPQFAAILETLGITPPLKESVANEGELTEAFGKNDPEFQGLMADYPQHRPLWEGRLATKSTIHITRTQKLLNIAKLSGKMPMPLNYWGAQTTGRWSGADGLNVQNLPKAGRIREAFTAPKGWKIIAPDSNKIELRVNMWFSGQMDKLQEAATGDIYKSEASRQFQKPISEVSYTERQFGKVVQLGCGYGMGWKKFRNTCASGPLGMDPIFITEAEAQNTIEGYRSGHPNVKESWYFLSDRLYEMLLPNCGIDHNGVQLVHNGIMLPGDMMIQYPNLYFADSPAYKGFRYGHNATDHKNPRIYGGKMQENIVQALARKIIADQMLELHKDDFIIISMTHDEIICLVPEHEAEQYLDRAIAVMSKSPSWAPDLPLGAEGHISDHYGK